MNRRNILFSADAFLALCRHSAVLPLVIASAFWLSGCAWMFPGEQRLVEVAGYPTVAGANAPGVVYGGMLYTAGFTPRDPQTGEVVRGDIAAQTHRVLDNLEAVLKRAGCSLGDVVKIDVLVADMRDAAKIDEVMAARFGDHKPARGAASVGRLPGRELLEADFIASLPHGQPMNENQRRPR